MKRHELKPGVRVAEEYEYKSLGAPFKVILKNAVEIEIDRDGKEWVKIPDMVGLQKAIVQCRVLDPQKLSGEEIRFLRKALCLPSAKLAEFLDLSPEHFSRCESEGKALSASSEKLLRLFAFVAAQYNNPEKLLEGEFDEAGPPKKRSKKEKRLNELSRVFIGMKIKTVRDACAEPITYSFYRGPDHACHGQPDDDSDWIERKAA